MIKRIHITNFKSLRDVEVSLDPLTVLIGRSGTGKTNFVKAIRFVRDFLGDPDQTPHAIARMSGGWESLLPIENPGERITFRMAFDTNNSGRDFDYFLAFDPKLGAEKDGVLSEESLSIEGEVIFRQFEGTWTTKPNLAKLPQRPRGSQLGILYGIHEAKLAHLSLTTGIGCYDFPSEVLENGTLDQNQDTALIDNGSNFLRAIEAITTDLDHYADWREIEAGIRCVNPTVTALDLDTVKRNTLVVSHQIGAAPIYNLPLKSESEGLRRLLAHLVSLYQVPSKPTLFFEEPEKGIYPGALAVLADFFKSHTSEGRSQIILTTHSPVLLDHFPVESIRVVELEPSGTKIGRLAPEQLQAVRESLLTPGELLLVTPARMETAA